MTGSRSLFRWSIGLLLLLHGFIHLLGPVEIWNLADIEALSGRPSIGLSRSVTELLAGVWLLAFLALVGAGIGLLTRRAWWAGWAVVGAIISQIAILIWWGEAATGTVPNLIVIAAVVLFPRPRPDPAKQGSGGAGDAQVTR